MKLSVRHKIILFLLMPIVGIYSSIMAFNIFKMRQWTIITLENRMTELANSYANRFDSKLREIAQAAVMTAAYLERNPHLSSEHIYSLLQANLQHNPLVYGSAVAFEPYKYRKDRRLFVRYVYRDGDALLQADPSETGYDYTDPKQEYWHEPRKTGKAIWTDPYYDEGAGNILMCTYSVPFFQNEEFLGIATIDIPLEPLREKVEIGVSKDIKFSIITKKGKYVYSPHIERINKSVSEIWNQTDDEDSIELARRIASGKIGFAKIDNWESEGLEWIFYTQVESAQWGFAASVQEQHALKAVQEQFYRGIIFLTSSLILIIVGLWFVTVKISRPILRLNNTVVEFAKGNLTAKADVKSDDEIGALSNAFNSMANRLSEREKEIVESEEHFRNLFEQSNDGIIIHRSGQIIDVNQRVCEILGYNKDQFLNMKIEDLHPKNNSEESAARIDNIFKKESLRFETQFKKVDGTLIDVEVSSRIIDYEEKLTQGIIRDITERKLAEVEREKLEAKLQQAYKMEAIGTLAGGIAHDFNNILTPIIVQSELALMDLDEDHPIQFNIKEVLKAGLRARDLVKQILTFSRQTEHQPVPLKITPIIREAIKLLRASLPSTIEIRLNLKEGTDTVTADPTQVHQVVMNLCTNAGHAMRERGGILEVNLSYVELGSEDWISPDLDPGPYLKLTVNDTGHGISPEVMDRIFDPFFSTKDRTEGTGMGLAVVHGIISSYGGAVIVESELDKGSTFNVFLSRTKSKIRDKTEDIRQIPTGSERVLVVDDEQGMVDTLKKMLDRLGYEIVANTSSLEVLDAFQAEPDKFDLVITDQTMPKMTGDELAKKIMEIRSDIPIILCTGFSERINEEKAREIGIKAFVMKPIEMREIAITIREVLDKK